MDIHVINLKRRSDRRKRFLLWNDRKGRSFSFFDAVEGSQDLRLELIAQGLLRDSANRFTLGALGCAQSHRMLWKRCVSMGTSLLIVEDDACLRSDFSEMVEPVISAAGENWDIIYLGYNTDVIMAIFGEDGSIQTVGFKEGGKKESDFFDLFSASADGEPPNISRCCQVWGTLAYLVSPKGAEKLCRHCFPLDSSQMVEMLGQGRSIRANGIDSMINLGLPHGTICGFCCLPPLVLGPNDKRDSDVDN